MGWEPLIEKRGIKSTTESTVPCTSNFKDKVETFGKQYLDSMIKSLIEHHQGIVESLKTELETKCSINLTDFERQYAAQEPRQ